MFRNRAGRRRWLVDVAASIFHFHFQHIRLPFWDVSFRFDVSWDVVGSSTTGAPRLDAHWYQWPTGRGIPPPKRPTAFPAIPAPDNSNTWTTTHSVPNQPTNQPASISRLLVLPLPPIPPSIHPSNHPLLKQRKLPRESSTGRRAELSEPGVGEAVLCMIPNSKNPPSSP